MSKTKYPLIRTIYLYLFALIGLVMVTIGAAKIIDIGLKTYIFTKADVKTTTPYYSAPRMVDDVKKVEKMIENKDKLQLTNEQVKSLNQWITDYEKWKKEQETETVDYITRNRHREVSEALSLMLVGLPLYIYHWGVIKRDIKNKKKTENS
jgi:hypothetical protein